MNQTFHPGSAAPADADRIRTLVAGMRADLERICRPRFARFDCSGEEQTRVVQRVVVAYFQALARGDGPEAALAHGLDDAETDLLTRRLDRARTGGAGVQHAFLDQLERMLDATDARQAAAIEAARGAFMRALDQGAALEAAVAAARTDARAVLAVGVRQPVA